MARQFPVRRDRRGRWRRRVVCTSRYTADAGWYAVRRRLPDRISAAALAARGCAAGASGGDRQRPAGEKKVGMMWWAATERHKDGVNVLFLDGHAERVPVPELWKLKWSETFEPTAVTLKR